MIKLGKLKLCLLLIICTIFTITNAQTTYTFRLPEIPSILTSPEARADFLVNHYWDNVDFTKAISPNNKDVIEQAWVDYCDVLNYVPLITAQKVMKSTIIGIKNNKQNLKIITDLADKYLYDPN